MTCLYFSAKLKSSRGLLSDDESPKLGRDDVSQLIVSVSSASASAGVGIQRVKALQEEGRIINFDQLDECTTRSRSLSFYLSRRNTTNMRCESAQQVDERINLFDKNGKRAKVAP